MKCRIAKPVFGFGTAMKIQSCVLFQFPGEQVCWRGGTVKRSSSQKIVLKVSSSLDDPDWGIVQSPFMESNAKILSFNREIKLSGNKLVYSQETCLFTRDQY